MSVLLSSDLAVCTDGSKIYVYYQDQNANINEVTSSDGKKWTASSDHVATGLMTWGSPITAYFVSHDGVSGGKSAIHVLYLAAAGELHEAIRQSSGGKWEQRTLKTDIQTEPINTSRLASGICHDSAPGAHQWLFFEGLNKETGVPQVTEFRSGDESHFEWELRKNLDEKPKKALPSTQLAAFLTNPYTHLFFQDHDGTLVEYIGTYKEWTESGTIREASQVQPSTPLAVAQSDEPEKPYIFYVASKAPLHVVQYQNGNVTDVATYVPGSRLGAINFAGTVMLFQIPLESPGNIYTRTFENGGWKLGSEAVA